MFLTSFIGMAAAAFVSVAEPLDGWATVFHSDEAGYYGILIGSVHTLGEEKIFPIVHATNEVRNDVFYSQGMATVDCQSKTIQIWQMSHFDRDYRMIGGGQIPMDQRVTEDVQPGTVGDSYYKVVCRGETPMEDLGQRDVGNLVDRFRRILAENQARADRPR